MKKKVKYKKVYISFLHDFGLRKVSPARQLLIQQVGFVNSRHFFQHRSRAKHGFKNLVILEPLHNTVCPKMAKSVYVVIE